MKTIDKVKMELGKHVDQDKADFLPGFFKAAPAGYGAGDRFLGVRVPLQRKVAKKYYKDVHLDELKELLQDSIHEYRLTALIMLVHQFQKAKTEDEREKIVHCYVENMDYVNNWDLVDASADKILGAYLYDKDRSILYEFAEADHLWKQRASVIATFYFIRKNDYKDTLELAKLLMDHPHHLIHKAIGWMLREVGKRDFETEYNFLKEHYSKMPRTMLRYSIEKFDEELRQKFLKGFI